MRMRGTIVAALTAVHTLAHGGFGGMSNVEGGDGAFATGFPALIPMLAGAAIGYYVERAYNKAKLDKEGGNYSSEYLGGKAGAIVGAIALPLLIGLFR